MSLEFALPNANPGLPRKPAVGSPWYTRAMRLRYVVLGVTCLLLGACKKQKTMQPTDRERAESYFAQKCALCHGEHGNGDGPGASGLNPRPRAFSDPAWQASVTNRQIERIIVQGGAAVGKSPSMPPNPDIQEDQQLVLDLRQIVRDFGGDAGQTK